MYRRGLRVCTMAMGRNMNGAMLIDEFLPRYDVAERHATEVRAPVERVWEAIGELDMSQSPVIHGLFRLRGMPPAFTLRGLQGVGFVLLGEEPNREIVLGLVGKFWTPTGYLQRVDADGFRAFDKAGYAKTAWNFVLAPQGDGTVRVTTETRVLCLDDRSRRRFRRYWVVVGPFSGWIRREVLRIIKVEAGQK
jgi:hypothetical protein